jgi:MFS family permease
MSVSQGTVAPDFGIAARPDAIALKALAASVIGYALDGFDLLILGFMLRAISADLGLSPTQAGSLVTWTLVGAVAGGIIFGILSDYYGRVRVLTWSILLFAVFTGLGAVAQGYWDLLVYRIIAGLGLGGEFGIGMALVAETWPAPLRARACSYVALGWQAGVLVAALVTPALLPIIGWRGMFLVGLIPGLVAFVVRLYVGEPNIFLSTMKAGRTKMPVALLVKDAATAKITLGMFVLCAIQNFGYYGLMIWMPSYLSGKFGFALTQSALWTAVTVFGHGVRHLDIRGLCRQGRPPAGAAGVPGRRIHHGAGLFPTQRPHDIADRRRGDGCIRQRHARRLRHFVGRTLSDPSTGHRRKCTVQPRSRRRRIRSARDRRARGHLFVHDGHRAPLHNLYRGHCSDARAYSGTQGAAFGIDRPS